MLRPDADLPVPEKGPATPDVLAAEIVNRLTYSTGKDPKSAKQHDWLEATIMVVRERIIDHWMELTRRAYARIPSASFIFRWSS